MNFAKTQLLFPHPKTHRPTSLISQGKQIAYSYDVYGNIKTKTETPLNPKTNEPIYQSDNDLIGYRKSVQFFYSPNNELQKTIAIKDVGLEVQRTTTQYHYDAFGRRIAKTSKVERLHKLNQKGELVRYPTALMHLRKTDKTTHQSTLMLWEGNRQIQEYTNDFVFTTVYDQDSFEAVARVVQGRNPIESDKTQETFKVYHYHNNHLGTPQELTDENGEVVWLGYDYAWGGRYTHHYTSQSLNDCAILEHDLQPIRFQGQFYDVETGLHYNRFRYYDSDVGMFIQRDPIGLLGGMNVYQYAPNPIHWVDVFGLIKLFRSMSRAEYFDIKYNGWDGKENMSSKWFAESYENAIKWGKEMGHGKDSKFYVVTFDVDDEIAERAHFPNNYDNYDNIGRARAIEVDDLNKNPPKIISINSHRNNC